MIEEMRIDKTFMCKKLKSTTKRQRNEKILQDEHDRKRPQLQRDRKDRYSAKNKISKKMVYFRF